jgi:hypothetical protein
MLQSVGLTVPPVIIVLQLVNAISAGQMLGMLVASVLVFTMGWLLAVYSK